MDADQEQRYIIDQVGEETDLDECSLCFAASCFSCVSDHCTALTVPTPKTLTYTGSGQELVNAGSTDDGTLYYAVTTENAAPTDDSLSTTSIPTATDAGTYYVWYKVVGDENHTSTTPVQLTVEIRQSKSEGETEPVPPVPDKPEAPQPPEPEAPVSPETEAPKPSETEAPVSPETEAPVDSPAEEPAPKEKETQASILLNSNFLVSCKGSKVQVSWGAVPNADTYEIYAAYCGKKDCRKIKTLPGGTKYTFKKLNGKKLNKKKHVKAYVVAYRKGVKLGRTILGHSAGSKTKYTDVGKLKVAKSSYKLKAGKTAKIKAIIIKKNSRKKLLGKGHCEKYRYASSDKTVATVDKNGRIKALRAGKCDIWVYAINGRSKRVTVTVKQQ